MSFAPNTSAICFSVVPSAPLASIASALVRLSGEIMKFPLRFCLSTCLKSEKAISFEDLKSCLITESSGDISGFLISCAASAFGECCLFFTQLVDASKNAGISRAIALNVFLFIYS